MYRDSVPQRFLHVTRNKLHYHILIWSSDVALKYLQKAGKLKLFNSRHYWLIILTSNFTFEEVQKQVKDVTFYIDSEISLAKKEYRKQDWVLKEIWRVGVGMGVLETAIGRWTPQKDIELYNLPHKYDRRKNLQGYHFRVAAQYQMDYSRTYCSLDSYYGVPRGPNQTWSGSFGLLQRGYFDIFVTPVVLSLKRFEVIDFSIPFMTTRTKLYIRRPDKSLGWDLYILPFGLEMWISIPFFIFITVNVSYGAFLVSVLTTAKPVLPFRTFEDLRDLEDWKVSVHMNSAFSTALKYANKGSAMREAWDNKIVKYWRKP
ncbi:Glutamate receptor 1 [Armadillidium vulgare]|nr:Glutamate receptor 1 [Armadillidium vulgare]